MDINYIGIALVLLGVSFLAAEAFLPTFGILGITGLVAFIVGSVLLFNTSIVDWIIILSVFIINVVFLLTIISLGIKARRRKVVTGQQQLIGMIGKVLNDFNHLGWVHVRGETWQAKTKIPLKQGQKVRIMSVKNLTLIVEPFE